MCKLGVEPIPSIVCPLATHSPSFECPDEHNSSVSTRFLNSETYINETEFYTPYGIRMGTLSSLGATAQVNEKFNCTLRRSPWRVRSHLQQHCWIINDFEVNDGWIPGIEGDGAMVSHTTASAGGVLAGGDTPALRRDPRRVGLS